MAEPDLAAVNTLTGLLQRRKDALTVRWLAVTVASALAAPLPSLVAGVAPKVPLAATIAFWVASAALCVLSVWLPRRELNDKLIAARLQEPINVPDWSVKMKLKSEQMRELEGLPELEQRLFGLTLVLERPYNVGLALSAGLALLGVAYGLLARTLVEASPALFGALALYCYHYPRLAPLVDRGRKIAARMEEEALVRGVTATAKTAEQANEQPARVRQRMPTPAKPTESAAKQLAALRQRMPTPGKPGEPQAAAVSAHQRVPTPGKPGEPQAAAVGARQRVPTPGKPGELQAAAVRARQRMPTPPARPMARSSVARDPALAPSTASEKGPLPPRKP
jgi:hypothetical protein